MRGEERLDNLSNIGYVIYDLILTEEEKAIIQNIGNNKDTNGLLKILAKRNSEIDISLNDKNPKEYIIDTNNIESREGR